MEAIKIILIKLSILITIKKLIDCSIIDESFTFRSSKKIESKRTSFFKKKLLKGKFERYLLVNFIKNSRKRCNKIKHSWGSDLSNDFPLQDGGFDQCCQFEKLNFGEDPSQNCYYRV